VAGVVSLLSVELDWGIAMTDLELKAKAFATKCHEDIKQVRKYTGEPYINHPTAF